MTSRENKADKETILRAITFGARVAEDEAEQLRSYFVETDQWMRMYRGDIDIVYGAKGSGKSAIYALLLSREDDLFDRRVLLVGAENPRGAPVFGQLAARPQTGEYELLNLWKLYFLSLLGGKLREYKIKNAPARLVVKELERAGLLQHKLSLSRVLRSVIDYAAALVRAESIETTVLVDPRTGMPSGMTGKITLREPSIRDRTQHGLMSLDETLALADRALEEADLRVWLLLDRLDIAFAESETLERSALRALFRAYGDLRSLSRVSLKIFLRSDIWDRITATGFRESSHLTRELTIAWNPDSLLTVVVRRLLRNEILLSEFEVNLHGAWRDVGVQSRLLYEIIPSRAAQARLATFDWILSLIRDGKGSVAPRELIHMMSAGRDAQIRSLETGHPQPPGRLLIELRAFREALSAVSRVRLKQTLYAEYPECGRWIDQLTGDRTRHTISTLAHAWLTGEGEAARRAEKLVEVAFLEELKGRHLSRYRIPLLYKPALGLSIDHD